MLIIDSNAEEKLIRALEDFRLNPDGTRCIELSLSRYALDKEKLLAVITPLVQSSIESSDREIYLCDDGDIYILASAVRTKDAHTIASGLTAAFPLPTNESWFTFHELSIHAGKLLLEVSEKFSRRMKAIEAIREASKRREKQEETAKKREAILGVKRPEESGDRIQKRRSERNTLEIMMIEDDPFSRRLVENVLGKEFNVTGLGEMESALETYIHLAPNVLFLDINLPDVNGHELLEKIVEIDPDAYVVMLSGNADRDNITRAMTRGAKGFVAKPFTREKLYQYIERCPTIAC